MAAGGYTYESRHVRPTRGSSTERTVDDVFDTDSGGLHFVPDMISRGVWDRRLGESIPEEPKRKRKSPAGAPGGAGRKAGAVHGPVPAENEITHKDPNAPKNARSSYIFFTNAMRSKMAGDHPGMKFTEQGVLMGEKWRALSAEDRVPYEEMARKDKERCVYTFGRTRRL